MTMQTRYHSEFMGASIYRQWGGYALPWTAWIDGQGTRAADTLAGLKSLIRDALAGGA
jgi:hypothetical protein